MLNKKLLGSVSSPPSDDNFENVSLLLSGDGTNGAQNNTFLDSSTNNFTITRNGNTTQGSFSPYGSNWSNFFDGSGDFLSRSFTSTTDGMYPQGTTYTIEAWIYMTSTSGTQYVYFVSATNTGSFGAVSIGVVSGVLEFAVRPTTGGSVVAVSGGTVVANTWNHIAASVSAGSARLFLNGTQVGSTTTVSAATFTPVGAAIGRIPNGFVTGVTDFTGYVSNLRLVNGSAVYTSAFTPSTTPLTAISGTSLLTCQSNRFIDNSTNNFAITVNGTPSVQRFSPFNPTAPYDTSVIGGSGYFDGSGDDLRISTNAAFALGTGNFTFEFWINPSNWTNTNVPAFAVSGTGGFYIGKVSTNFAVRAFGVGDQLTHATLPTINAWTHIVAVRSGTTLSLYYNGTRVATTTNSYNFAQAGATIGGDGDTGAPSYYTGLISNLRLVKGTAVYDPTQTTLTVPTAPVTAVTNTSLLTNFTNAGIPDLAMQNNLETVGNAQVSTSVKKYGTGSLAFDGSGDGLLSPISPNNAVGTVFTVEAWIYPTASSGQIVMNTTSSNGFQIGYQSGSSWGLATVGTAWRVTSSTMPTLNTWNHIAVVRAGTGSNQVWVYLNGVSVANGTSSDAYTTAAGITVGYVSDNSSYFSGYIDDVRITKGLVRYPNGTTFTPPASALPTY